MLDDPDDLQARALVSGRVHGTAMASLIVHGDLNVHDAPLGRPLYVRPLMITAANGEERTEDNRLLVDTIHRAILRMKGAEGEEAAAPTVFMVNLSMGDPRRPFTRLVSPLARLLDFLSAQYNILFLISAGNVRLPLVLNGFDNWTDFETADPGVRERAVLTALNEAKHERSILSPAESLNALTVGAQHHDNVRERAPAPNAVDPFDDHELPNASSALGLGYHRTVKPDIYLPGGREFLRMRRAGGGVEVTFGAPQRIYGLGAACPDAAGRGRMDRTALSDGTSSATALATRSAHTIFDSLMDREGGSLFADMPPEYYAVVIKALLVHRARWNSKGDLLKDICGPADRRQFVARAENASRFMGFGIPVVAEVLDCASNRATLLGYGTLRSEQAHDYRIPLPGSLERVTHPRALTVTTAWFSPIRPGYQGYRCMKLEAAPAEPELAFGVIRCSAQPADASVRKGTIFHERYSGERAVPFIEDGHVVLKLWCKDDSGAIEQPARYAVAVTIEADGAIPVYEEIQQRLRVRSRPQP
jgi:Subtilase family